MANYRIIMNGLTRYEERRSEDAYFLARFCEPPKRRIDSINVSCDEPELLLARAFAWIDVESAARTVSLPLPSRRTG